jgi:hypothetical protein
MRGRLRTAALASATMMAFVSPAAGQDKVSVVANTGIAVSEIKIYDDRTLQLMMLDLASRLGQVSPIDQASLIAKIGSLQGANSSTSSFSLQIAGPSVSGVSTKNTSSAPTVQDITSATPSTTVNSPGMQTEVTRTAGAMTPSAPALPTYGAIAAPTAYGVSSLDALGEQVQLGYELTNLRLLLQGSLNDDYGSNNDARRHVTFGFPISIETPGRKFRDEVAEVEVAVCNPPENYVNDAPLVQHVLPREKTYTVASLTSSSAQLGVSAVVSSLVNVGASFFHGRQTYYMVRDQDTIAVERPSDASSVVCGKAGSAALPRPDRQVPNGTSKSTAPPPRPAPGATPAVFAWQFRPVLGRRTVQQGMRQTFAQIAFAPGITDPARIPDLQVSVRTCWRKYDAKTGIVGVRTACTQFADRQVRMAFDTTKINGLQATDNLDGTISVALNGTYPVGTRIGYGDVAAGEGNVGFSNARGRLRFTAPNQLLAVRGARILSPDGSERDIADGGQFWRDESTKDRAQFSIAGILPPGSRYVSAGQSYDMSQMVDRSLVIAPRATLGDRLATIAIGGRTCGVPDPGREVAGAFRSVSATQVEVALSTQVCPELGPQGASFKPYALLGGKAYGLSDAPFTSSDATRVTFTAPRSAIQGKTVVIVRRLFTDRVYDQRFVLDGTASASVASIAVMGTSSAGATFVMTGTRLTGTKSLSPAGLSITTPDDTIAIVKLDKSQMDSTKKMLLKLSDGQAVLVDLPAVDAAPAAKKAKLKPSATVSRTAPAAVQIDGTNLDLVSSVEWLGKQLPFVRSADGTSIVISGLPPELFATQGVASLLVRSSDGAMQGYDLTVGP